MLIAVYQVARFHRQVLNRIDTAEHELKRCRFAFGNGCRIRVFFEI
jgi:hypothetical protein